MADLLARRESAFVLWHATQAATPPHLIIGWVQPGTPVQLIGEQRLAMRLAVGFDDVWELPAVECNLVDGWVYYYWFEIDGFEIDRFEIEGLAVAGFEVAGPKFARPRAAQPGERVRITDPCATAIDWRLLSGWPGTEGIRQPAAAIQYRAGRLVSTDVGGELPSFAGAPLPHGLPTNNRLVIYKLPTAWALPGATDAAQVGVGTFSDVVSLIDVNAAGTTFEALAVTRPGRAYLTGELGVNALELMPMADSVEPRAWACTTTHPFAPDFELGFPTTYSWPAPNRDLVDLARTCRIHGMRFIADMMTTAVAPSRYETFAATYDPVSGLSGWFSPARQMMKAAVDRWVTDFHIDGVRLDGIDSIASSDFLRELKDHARLRNRERYSALGLSSAADERFIVIGDALPEPAALVEQQRLDSIWHYAFKDYLRMALVGRQHEDAPDFASTVRRAIDCREWGFTDLTQAVIYLTSPDVDGFRNERLFNFFRFNGVVDMEKRTKLAFACLLTAVGLPMILAGEEFAEKDDHRVDFSRLEDDWRDRIKTYASRLIHLRTTYDALAVNDLEFIHVDFEEGKRVIAWRRGVAGSESQVVVVANFSEFTTPEADTREDAEYIVNGWPEAPENRRWREVAQERWVDVARAGREPIYAWEAKVYALY